MYICVQSINVLYNEKYLNDAAIPAWQPSTFSLDGIARRVMYVFLWIESNEFASLHVFVGQKVNYRIVEYSIILGLVGASFFLEKHCLQFLAQELHILEKLLQKVIHIKYNVKFFGPRNSISTILLSL